MCLDYTGALLDKCILAVPGDVSLRTYDEPYVRTCKRMAKRKALLTARTGKFIFETRWVLFILTPKFLEENDLSETL